MNKPNDDLKLYEEFFRRYYKSLCAYVYSYLPDMEVVKDVVQDTFTSLWAQRERYRLTSTLLYTVARNKTIDHLKADPRTKRAKGLPPDILTDAMQTDCEGELDAKRAIEEVWKCAETLPPQCRAVFIMSRRDNFKNKEIASRLDISVKAVEKHLTKALSLTRTYFLKNGITFLITLLSIFFALK